MFEDEQNKDIENAKNQLFGFLQDVRGLCIISSHFLETKDNVSPKACSAWIKSLDDDTLYEVANFFKYVEQTAEKLTPEDMENTKKEFDSLDKLKIDKFNKLIHDEGVDKNNVLDVAEKTVFFDSRNEDNFDDIVNIPVAKDLDLKNIFTETQLDLTSKFFDSYNLVDMILAWEMGLEFSTWDEFLNLKKIIDFSTSFDINYIYIQNIIILAKEEHYFRNKDASIFFKSNDLSEEDINLIIEDSFIEKVPSLSIVHNFSLVYWFFNHMIEMGYEPCENAVQEDTNFLTKSSYYARTENELIILNIDLANDLEKQFQISIYDIEQDKVTFSFSSPYFKQVLDWSIKYLDKNINLDLVKVVSSKFYLRSILL